MYPINKQAVHNCLIFEMYLLPKHNRYKFVCNSLMQCPMKTRITTYYSDNFTFQCGWCIPWPFSIFNRRHVAIILFFFPPPSCNTFLLSDFTLHLSLITKDVVRVELFLVLLIAFDFFTSKIESLAVCLFDDPAIVHCGHN
jgi:hypothetical protein